MASRTTCRSSRLRTQESDVIITDIKPNELEPRTYYQDVLTDGSRSCLRQNFPALKRVSYDKRPKVVRTLKIVVEDLNQPIYSEPSPAPAQEEMLQNYMEEAEALFRKAK